jgi:predicted GNAT family acetyltransferase
MNFIEKIRSCSPILRNGEIILKAFGFEKSRVGVYSDNSQNRKLKRVGQKYGSKKQEEGPSPEKNKKTEETKVTGEKSIDENKIKTFAKKATDEQLQAYLKYDKATPEIKKIAKLELDSRNKSEGELHDHARKSSQQDLENTIKTHKDEKVRKVAHKEIDRRSKEEAIQKEPEKKEVEKKPEVKKEEKELKINENKYDSGILITIGESMGSRVNGMLSNDGKIFRINSTFVKEEERGQGLAKKMYLKLFEDLKKRGVEKVKSDNQVEEIAGKIYQGLEKEVFKVIKNKGAVLEKDPVGNFWWVPSNDKESPFEINLKEEK